MSLRVAVVGGGPKALHALERLVAHVRAAGGAPVAVDLYEPSTPGAGPAYAPDLHPALLMNLRSELVDAWPRTGALPVPLDADHPSFPAWATRRGEAISEYAPRAVVGAYLVDALSQIVRDGAPGIAVTVRPIRVDDVRPAATTVGWVLRDRNGLRLGDYDEVLMATGHGPPGGWASGMDARRLDRLPIGPGVVLATRGFGLTTLDLVRLLEARGALGGPAAAVHAVSRTGRPPLAKPSAAVEHELRGRCSPAADGQGWPAQGQLTTAYLRQQVVAEATQVLTPRGHGRAERSAQVEAALAELLARTVVDEAEAVDRLRRSVTEGSGRAEPGAVTAIGVAWRALQATIVRHGSFGGLPAAELEGFRHLAAALELVGFGPPLESAESLLRAMEAGAVRSWAPPASLRQHGARFTLDTGRATVHLDGAFDTVLPQPGVQPRSPLRRLVDGGQLALAPGARGAWTATDGTALAPGGTSAAGLAVIGRPTEDWVLGNDTLSRTTHDVGEQWGARLAQVALQVPTRANAAAPTPARSRAAGVVA